MQGYKKFRGMAEGVDITWKDDESHRMWKVIECDVIGKILNPEGLNSQWARTQKLDA